MSPDGQDKSFHDGGSPRKFQFGVQEIEEVPDTPNLTGRTEELGTDISAPPLKLTRAEERRLYRKIDYRLVTILTLMQLCSFLDKGGQFQSR